MSIDYDELSGLPLVHLERDPELGERFLADAALTVMRVEKSIVKLEAVGCTASHVPGETIVSLSLELLNVRPA